MKNRNSVSASESVSKTGLRVAIPIPIAIPNNKCVIVLGFQLLFLESSDPTKDIMIYMNSPGGSVYAGLGIYDTMQYINPDVATICTGMAASMGAVLLCAGTKGKRSALKHSRVMIHQPLGGAQGQASDIEITAREIKKLKNELYQIIADHSGKPFDTVWESRIDAEAHTTIEDFINNSLTVPTAVCLTHKCNQCRT